MDETPVPTWLSRAASVAWPYLAVLAAIYVTFLALSIVKVVAIPVILALFPASVLSPLVEMLRRRGWSPVPATWASILAVIPVLGVIVAISVPSIAGSVDELSGDLEAASESLSGWLATGPLQLSDTEVEDYLDSAIASIRENASSITSGVLGGATVAIEVVTGLVLLVLSMFFFLKDGDRAVAGILRRSRHEERTRRGFEAAWTTLSSYVRGLMVVGVVDSVFIGIGLAIVGTPLIAVLMLLVFVGAFFPVVGAFVSGLVAVAVTLVNEGVSDALIVLAIVVAVQQIEGHVLYPIVFRRALSLHPLVILLALGTGGVAFGIVGAFLAVPITAVAVAVHQAMADAPEDSYVALLSSHPYEGKGPMPDLADDDPPHDA